MTASTGYASSSQSLVHFGLGASTVADRVEIEWPSGLRQVLKDLPADQLKGVQEE